MREKEWTEKYIAHTHTHTGSNEYNIHSFNSYLQSVSHGPDSALGTWIILINKTKVPVLLQLTLQGRDMGH